MLQTALNHMAVPGMRWDAFIALAQRLGCVGVEFRDDLEGPLLGGEDPAKVKAVAAAAGIRILALAEITRFDDWTDQTARDAQRLIKIATSCGAEAVSLIPCNDGSATDLRHALREVLPMLRRENLIGLVEPLGFETASLRFKSDAVDAIEAVGGADTFRLVHDTFHHALAGETEIFAAYTGLVHISGVSDPAPTFAKMQDAHRGMVDAGDRLGNLNQIAALTAKGYAGAISVEPFAPEFHAITDPAAALAGSFEFISSRLSAKAA